MSGKIVHNGVVIGNPTPHRFCKLYGATLGLLKGHMINMRGQKMINRIGKKKKTFLQYNIFQTEVFLTFPLFLLLQSID